MKLANDLTLDMETKTVAKSKIFATMKYIFLKVIFPPAQNAVKAEMHTVLSEIKFHHTPEIYRQILRSLHSNFMLLKETALISSVHLEDGIVELMLELIKRNALENGFVLYDNH